VAVNLRLLGPKYLVDGSTWSGVEEEDNEGNKEEEDEELEQLPLEVLPDDILQGLQRVHEPQERRVGATANITGNVHTVSRQQQTHREKCSQMSGCKHFMSNVNNVAVTTNTSREMFSVGTTNTS